MTDQRHRPPAGDLRRPGDDDRPSPRPSTSCEAYFARRVERTFDLPLALHGTPFQRRVWAALRTIPYGETRLVRRARRTRSAVPTASRAVGLANGKNPVGIIVPCHRVVGANGSLTGYGGGLDRKRRLLAFERTEDALFPAEACG